MSKTNTPSKLSDLRLSLPVMHIYLKSFPSMISCCPMPSFFYFSLLEKSNISKMLPSTVFPSLCSPNSFLNCVWFDCIHRGEKMWNRHQPCWMLQWSAWRASTEGRNLRWSQSPKFSLWRTFAEPKELGDRVSRVALQVCKGCKGQRIQILCVNNVGEEIYLYMDFEFLTDCTEAIC